MTSFNEGNINRDADGKFAAKVTGETDASALGDVEEFNAWIDSMRNAVPDDQQAAKVASQHAAEADEDDALKTAMRMCEPRHDHGFSGLSDREDIETHLDDVEADIDNLYESGIIKQSEYARGITAARAQASRRLADIQIAGGGKRARLDVPTSYQVGDSTPFGKVVARSEMSAGLAHVTTDRSGDGVQMHEGYVLSDRRQQQMGALAGETTFYEGDADANLVAMRFPSDMNVKRDKEARDIERSVRRMYPERYEAYMNETASPAPVNDLIQKSAEVDLDRRRQLAEATTIRHEIMRSGESNPKDKARYNAMASLDENRQSVLVQAYGRGFTTDDARRVRQLSDIEADNLAYRATQTRLSQDDLPNR